ncbi:hypothetical protein VTL71DRAFT_1602 [Oculimacula yallundae]|uniref:Heterokaryon incompatibility domain-containing protein n=1 Tax=Oculimacula yallundae TaxID=86028 RepID=A0ABR4CDJ9_9HELO
MSHCWGTTKFDSLTSVNKARLKKTILSSSLSRTFNDAIKLTRDLGFRYLWIDYLCIIEDSKKAWEYHASKMADIYTKSFLTISASRGQNGDRGLFGLKSDEPLKLVHSDLQRISDSLIWQPFRMIGKDRDVCVRNFAGLLRCPHGLYEDIKPKEPLLKRAWVFQEQILSPRLIHFASGELGRHAWGKAHSVLLSRSGKTIESPVKRKEEFEAYRAIVEAYTQLAIAQELDRLPALSGVTFGRSDDYLAGMWRSLLLGSLHWCPNLSNEHGVMARRPSSWRGPSWSWVSMECSIHHIYAERLDPRGQVSKAHIKIIGPFSTATVAELGFCSGEIGWNSQKVTDGPWAAVLEPSQNQWAKPEQNCTYATVEQGE